MSMETVVCVRENPLRCVSGEADRPHLKKRTLADIIFCSGLTPHKAVKEAAGMEELLLGDLVQMRKTHPCGSDKWTVIRVGADIKIRCQGCSRIVMMDRADFVKRMKKIIAHSEVPIRGTNEMDD